MDLDQELLAIMVCPKCKGEIHLSDNENGIVCDQCRLLYPIVAGIPVMLIEEAKKLEAC